MGDNNIEKGSGLAVDCSGKPVETAHFILT
jgi:hypothetical protein